MSALLFFWFMLCVVLPICGLYWWVISRLTDALVKRLTDRAMRKRGIVPQSRGRSIPDFTQWTCHFCGDLRPDGQIKVVSVDSYIGEAEMRQTRRYCADREACREKAMAWQAETFAKENPDSSMSKL